MGSLTSGKLIIFSAPSGAGKSTVVRRLEKLFPQLEFSISATSRSPRGEEVNGVEYYFLTKDEFRAKVDSGEFVEWEEVYQGTCYGTLRSEMERIWADGNTIIFDVDVKGGIALKEKFGSRALSLFIMPPSVEELRKRLEGRGTDAADVIDKRIAKAEYEISFAKYFDDVVVNDDLDAAVKEAATIVGNFLRQ